METIQWLAAIQEHSLGGMYDQGLLVLPPTTNSQLPNNNPKLASNARP